LETLRGISHFLFQETRPVPIVPDVPCVSFTVFRQ
jgi:hypothetical protein